MPPRLPRYDPNQHHHAARAVDKAVRSRLDDEAPITTRAGGDRHQLRGIPVVGTSTGAIPNTDPLKALLDQEEDETPRPKRQPLTPYQRNWIIDRDNATCYLCGLSCWPHEIHIDHVTPVSRGGTNHPNNLRVTCVTCNLRKQATMPNDPAPVMTKVKRPARYYRHYRRNARDW